MAPVRRRGHGRRVRFRKTPERAPKRPPYTPFSKCPIIHVERSIMWSWLMVKIAPPTLEHERPMPRSST